jgi:RNA polymerase sigma-70 factor (ECF subfamily)
MSADSSSFEEVLVQLRRQDEAAATQVFERFGKRLMGLARTQLDSHLQSKLDPEDIVQSVFRTVFLRMREGQFDLGSWDSLWGLMARVTVRKCGKWRDYYGAAARNVSQERAQPIGGDESDGSWQALDREPAPEEVAMLSETLGQVLTDLDEREEEIVVLSLQGFKPQEISARLDCTESKVYRLLKRARKRLERLRDQED